MKGLRRRIVLIVLIVVLALAGAWLWLTWDHDYGPIRANFDKVSIGMPIDEAEKILGMPQWDFDYSWDNYTGPDSIAFDTAQTGPWESEKKYYNKGNYWVILSYNPSSKRIISKDLMKKPGPLQVLYKWYFTPRWSFSR
jgi:hypothetical protein